MKIKKNDIGKIITMFENGKTYSYIGKYFGVKAWTIQKRLRSIGIENKKSTIKNITNNIFLIVEPEEVLKILNYNIKKYRFLYSIDYEDLYDIIYDYILYLRDKEYNYLCTCDNPKSALMHSIRTNWNYVFHKVKKIRTIQKINSLYI